MGGNPEREPPFFFMKPADSAFSATEFGDNNKKTDDFLKMRECTHGVTYFRHADPLSNILLQLPL